MTTPAEQATPDTAKRRKSNALASRLGRDDPRLCFTIAEFCRAVRIGATSYRTLQKAGSGPREILVNRKILIPAKAVEAWIDAMLKESDPSTAILDQEPDRPDQSEQIPETTRRG